MVKQQANGSQIKNMPVTRHDNTTRIKQTDVRIETGWGHIVGNGTGALSESVSFETAFTEKPIVTISSGGDSANTTPSYGSGGNNVHGIVTAKAYGITVGSFTAYVGTPSGTWSTSQSVYYQWTAIGR